MSRELREMALAHLEALVGYDTQNPPREIDRGGIFAYLRRHLGGFELDQWDLGDGCLGLHARRGDPDLLFNFHVDTVPASERWSADPLELRVGEGRAVGLGACDIKGAGACMLAALEALGSTPEVGLLFTSDEEAGSSRCVRRFLDEDRSYPDVVVAEPTRGVAVAEHRGIATATGRFSGRAGHASSERARRDNALHHLGQWASDALAHADACESDRFRDLNGIRFNLGRIEGGVKPNVVAPEATVRFGVRPRPDQEMETVLEELFALVPESAAAHGAVEWEKGFVAPSLPADPGERAGGRALADELGLPVGDSVDFWTEAALFSASGARAVVFGPGAIAQAHTADESVGVDQLASVADDYLKILEAHR